MTCRTNLPATLDPTTLEHVIRERGIERRYARMLTPAEEQAEREAMAAQLASLPTPKRRAPKDWRCQECGRRMTLKAAERATSEGCPKCGGVDIDLEVAS